MRPHPGARRLHEGHQLALVVRRAAAADHRAARRVLNLGIERVAVPKLKRIGRLHVVVAVEEEVRRARPHMAHHHRSARRLAHARLGAKAAQVGGQPLGGAGTVSGIGRVGGDGWDAQELQEAPRGEGQLGVEPGEDGV